MSSSTVLLPLNAYGAVKFSPWEAFDKLWTFVAGYPAEDFQFIPGETPMATLREALGTVVLYYAVIFGGQAVMKSRPAYKLNGLFMAHNLMLTVVSASLLILFAQQLIPSLWKYGLYDGICGGSGWTKPLVTLYYLNYITKYVELLDTVFLVLKKKPLTFLHCYHHPATALLCYTQLVGHTPVSWVPITLNLFVHVVMYWYYFQSARGIRITWKEWITRLQIGQFLIDLVAVYFASWNYWTSTYHKSLPHVGSCAGEPYAAVAGCTILSSYLVLFISFYLATYKTTVKRTTIKPQDVKSGGKS
ncbi:hypothetical protein SBOR_7489 [Sclerotinia borealis F-4128]|uniref:Elongation of fatty acids protein n=1 Tax=Sclerotinia borealis (strain F-4128) TaxID=1432307 RepID=W9CC09_SCLBF|nr:hypothetical protein SBOR_7489 [Sclerotinia borealis F-4128]